MKDFYKNKKVLITGHTGFKGAWLSQILLNFGADVVGVSLPPETSPNLFEVLGVRKGVANHFIDIRNYSELKGVFEKEKPEIVFHLAAQAIVRNSYDEPLKTISTNVVGTANVLQAIKETPNVRSAVIITTDKVYENKESGHAYKETDPLGGYDPYSSSKAAADIVTASYIQSFFNLKDFKTGHNTLVAIARAGNVIGGGDWADHRLIPDIMRSVYEKNEPVVIRSPRSIRPWEHVLEPLSGYLMLGQKLYDEETGFSGAWNFGPYDDSFVTVGELVERAVKILGRGVIDIKPDLSNKHEAGILKLDIAKAVSVLGWKPKFNLEENMAATFSWYKNYYEKGQDVVEFTNNQIKNFFRYN